MKQRRQTVTPTTREGPSLTSSHTTHSRSPLSSSTQIRKVFSNVFSFYAFVLFFSVCFLAILVLVRVLRFEREELQVSRSFELLSAQSHTVHSVEVVDASSATTPILDYITRSQQENSKRPLRPAVFRHTSVEEWDALHRWTPAAFARGQLLPYILLLLHYFTGVLSLLFASVMFFLV
jgi:hypothetical protein